MQNRLASRIVGMFIKYIFDMIKDWFY